MTLREPPRAPRGDLVDGRFVVPDSPDGELVCVSPADLDDAIGTWPYAVAHAAASVDAARAALASWRRARPEIRAGHLRAYAFALKARREPMSVAIARAIGKPLWEARTEVDAMIAKVAITLGAGLDLVRDQTRPDGTAIRYRPVGVCAVIGPFNFPGHLANGHLVPALATGNTVVYKPSERAPELAELMAECFVDAGFPGGVVNVVQGPRAVAQALVENGSVDAVMFTGSTDVGRAILRASAHWPGRMVALEMGGHNAAIVLDDADLSHAAREIAFSAYVTAGQRCTATRRVLVHRSVAEALMARLAVSARHTRVGPPDEDDVFLGPVITEQARDHAFAAAAQLAGTHEAVVPIRIPRLPVRGHYLSPSLYVRRTPASYHPHECAELFAPVLTLELVESDDEAVARANASEYGLACSVFTARAERFDAIADELDVGVCNWNRGTVGSSSQLPFGGVKRSGNHRPAGLVSVQYCVDPVAQIRQERPVTTPLPPGLRVG